MFIVDEFGNFDLPQHRFKPEPPPISLLQYLKWEAKREDKVEFHNGQKVKLPGSPGRQNLLSANIIAAVGMASKASTNLYHAFASKQKIYLPEINHVLYPGSLVVSKSPLFWDDDELLLINPLLVADVLAYNIEKFYETYKFDFYKTCPSFQEYLLVRQDTCEVETRFREEPNLWRETVVKDPNGTVHLRSIGCDISMEDIYENIEFPAPKGKK